MATLEDRTQSQEQKERELRELKARLDVIRARRALTKTRLMNAKASFEAARAIAAERWEQGGEEFIEMRREFEEGRSSLEAVRGRLRKFAKAAQTSVRVT